MEWLIENIPELKSGYWPRHPDGSSYTEPQGKKRVNPHAPFEIPEQFASEIEARLEHCGIDGLMAKLYYCYGESVNTIARHFRKSSGIISFRIDAALNFITGWERKRTRYDNRARHYYGNLKSQKERPA